MRSRNCTVPPTSDALAATGSSSASDAFPDLNLDVRADRAAENQPHSAQAHRLAHVKQQAGAGLEVAEFG